MKNQKGFTLIELLIAIVAFGIILPLAGGYIANIVKITRYDFASPYKAEFIRGVGIVMPPVGGVLGFCTIDDTKK